MSGKSISIAPWLFCISQPLTAHAQACCVTSAGVSPTRLALHERFGVGMTIRASWSLGQHDADARFLPKAGATKEIGVAEDVFAAVRWLDRGQLAALVPIIQTYRRSRTEASSGAGFGDVHLTARYDWIWASRYRYLPGIAVLGGLTLPTGKPPDRANHRLGTDATGRGVYEGQVGIAIEKAIRQVVLSLAGLAALRSQAQFGSVTLAAAPELRLIGALTYVFPQEQALGVYASLSAEGNSRVNGVASRGSARREFQLGAYAALPLSETVKLRFGAAGQPPLDGLGRNQPALVSAFVGANWSYL